MYLNVIFYPDTRVSLTGHIIYLGLVPDFPHVFSVLLALFAFICFYGIFVMTWPLFAVNSSQNNETLSFAARTKNSQP